MFLLLNSEFFEICFLKFFKLAIEPQNSKKSCKQKSNFSENFALYKIISKTFYGTGQNNTKKFLKRDP